MGFVIRWFINAVALYVTTLIVPGVKVPDFGALLVAALALGIVNRPVVLLFTLPLNIMTLGAFTLVVNAGMLSLVAGVTHRLRLESLWWALLGAIVLSVVSAVISRQVED